MDSETTGGIGAHAAPKTDATHTSESIPRAPVRISGTSGRTSEVAAPNRSGATAIPKASTNRNAASTGPASFMPGSGAVTAAGIFARIAVTAVFVANVMCAVQFIVAPAASAAGYGLATDYATQALVAGLGVAFLMWNCTYPAVIVDPLRFRGLFRVVLVQQVVGLVGELLIRMNLVAQGMHDSLMCAGIDQFVLWDAGGLLAMGATYLALEIALHRARRSAK